MEEQVLESVQEVVNGNMVEETEMNTEEAEVDQEEVRKVEDEDEDDEEFYERIEAPKFIDFTKPYPFRTDDRYWFCSRVGCDRKHEEEINPEEISKNFVLRVLAARSPNIKLRRALNRDQSSMKCPLSAPAKPSKPRIPRLAGVSCSISQKICEPQSNIRPCSKVGSTPVVKTRQVAAKYMTTPRNKKCLPNPNSCQSVPNPKTTTVDVAKNRTVAKALVFHSPKKAISLKKSVELRTPLKKICEGMKRLEIASQKKTSKSIKSKLTEDSSRKQLKICKADKKSKDLAPSKSTKKIPNRNESGDMDVDVKTEEDLQPKETSDNSIPHASKAEINLLPNLEDKEKNEDDDKENARNLEDKEDMGSLEHHSNEDDGKENAPNPQDNNRFKNQALGNKILGKETLKKNKVVQTARPALAKCKKPQPTNVKPFRLRTDERGILKEAILERKLNLPAHEKEVAKDTTCLVKKRMQVGSKPVPNTTQQRPKASLRSRSPSIQPQPQGVASPRKKIRRPGQQLGVIKEKSCKLTSDEVAVNKSRAASAPKGKLSVTIAKEPNFHTSHLPRGCFKKTA
ncbi:unnamed protein product [Lactuca saligna]|uniref:Uncharacterized protein n=1 Tax=Lactuca saligna TaxID=75948 RepID=A0AA35Z7E3_LACSI|nr:unnamed protein product [Lactuca saligna]